jgi:outer membrane protein TolC
LTAQGGYESTALRLLFTPQNALYNVAANITQPIFDGFQLEGQLEFAQGRQFELLKTYCQTVLNGFRDVEVALIAIADGAERERLQQAVVTSSRRAFELSEVRLREGVADLVVVTQTQQTLFTAEDNLVLARLARLQAVLSLFQALGGGWLPPGVQAPGRLAQ